MLQHFLYLCKMLYYRRKILLALLETFGGNLTAKSLQKYLFLFTQTQENPAFDFIPYKYGCFSFQANQDILTMQKYGYIEIIEKENGRLISLQKGKPIFPLLIDSDQIKLKETKKRFEHFSQTELIRFTYKKHPYYAINSTIAQDLLTETELKIVEQQKVNKSEQQLFSIGYEGISLETYINKLIQNDVHVLCDVRKNAFSQKYGFSKNQLQKACEGVGIQYLHIPELGIESDKRQTLNSQKDYDILFEQYEQTTLKEKKEYIFKIQHIIEVEKRVALTCFEKDPAQCHRTRIIKVLMNLPEIKYSYKTL